MVMDSERDKEEFQGREVFVSQLLDWDSMIHQLVIPADKVEAFKAHYSSSDMDGKPHAVTIMIDNDGFKAIALETERSSGDGKVIQLIYSPEFVAALKNKFNDLYSQLSKNKEKKNISCPVKVHITLLIGDLPDVYFLNYRSEGTIIKPNLNSWHKVFNTDHSQFSYQTTTELESEDSNSNRISHKLIDLPSTTLKDDISLLIYIHPIFFSFNGHKHFTHNWKNFVEKLSTVLYQTEYGFLLKCAKRKDYDFTSRYCLSAIPECLKSPKKIGPELWIETNFNVKQLVLFSKWMVTWCNLDLKDIVVYYEKKGNTVIHNKDNDEKELRTTHSPLETQASGAVQQLSQKDNKPFTWNLKVKSFSLGNDVPYLQQTNPIDFVYQHQIYKINDWKSFIVKIAQIVYKKSFGYRLKLATSADYDFTKKNCISTWKSGMVAPMEIANNLWIETDMSATMLAKFAQWMVKWCYLDTKTFIVHYEFVDNEKTESDKQPLTSQVKRDPVLEVKSSVKVQLVPQETSLTISNEKNRNFLIDDGNTTSSISIEADTTKQNLFRKYFDDSSRQIIFCKRLNWSMMTLGTNIPSERIESFLANLSYQPVKGHMYPITLIWNGQEYSAKMEDVNYSRTLQYRTVQIRYTPSSPIAIAFQNKFQSAYQQMQIDHKNTAGVDVFITLITTNRLDCFEIKISNTQVDSASSDIISSAKYEDAVTSSETQQSLKKSPESFSSEFIEECKQILENFFIRGFKQGSIIDKNKFSRKYEELFGKPLTAYNVGQVWDACAVVGIVVEDKVFPLTDAAKETAKRHAEELIQKGARQIYFSSLFDQFLDEFCENGIGSSDVLAAVLSKLYPEYIRTEQFIQIDSTISSEDEIFRILREFGALALKDMQEKLPGMTEESILQACKACKDVVKDGDKYILLDNIQFDEEEIIQARNVIESSIEDHGYVMLREINLENSLVLNDDISFEALAKVAFSKYFADDFSLANSLVSRKGESLSVSKIVKAFCEDHTQFTLKEVEEFANQINGYDSAHSLGIAQDNAIQVDDEHFVHPSLVDFDVDEIDKAIENVMTDKMQPLLAFKTFFNFPAVPGYPWTLKLLASYCRHFSHEFTLLEHAPNNVSIGIIIHKNIHCNSYYQAVAMMALNDGIPMDSDSIGNYAIRKGFLNRKRPSALSSILSEMQQLSGEA